MRTVYRCELIKELRQGPLHSSIRGPSTVPGPTQTWAPSAHSLPYHPPLGDFSSVITTSAPDTDLFKLHYRSIVLLRDIFHCSRMSPSKCTAGSRRRWLGIKWVSKIMTVPLKCRTSKKMLKI